MPVPLTALEWLRRAEEARQEAAAMHDPTAKRMMLVIAAGYVRLAEYAASFQHLGLPHEAQQSDRFAD